MRWWTACWPWLRLEGVVGIAAGLFAFLWPDITMLVLLYLIAAWMVVAGLLEVAAAIVLRRELRGEWLLALAGIRSLAFGVLLTVRPGKAPSPSSERSACSHRVRGRAAAPRRPASPAPEPHQLERPAVMSLSA
jgi:hypothetical protein